MVSLLVLGAGGHAKVVADTALTSGFATSLAFLDDRYDSRLDSQTFLGFNIVGSLDDSLHDNLFSNYSHAAVAIGNNRLRLSWIRKLEHKGYSLPTLIHPSSTVSRFATISSGSVVFSQTVVQADASVGQGVILNTGCSIDHDVYLSDGVHISPGARLGGGVSVGETTWIGMGASVIQQVSIGSDVTVGAGAVVISDLPYGVTAIGIPARFST